MSKIDKGDGPGFSSDIYSNSLAWVVHQDLGCSSRFRTVSIPYSISHACRASLHDVIMRASIRARACGRFKINNNYLFRIFLPIIQLFKIVPYYSKFYSRIISAGQPIGSSTL